jgi:SNF2 family DNA or RNA helicase
MEATAPSIDEPITRFKTKPYRHQLEYLNTHGRKIASALLADMGTGKTFCIINNAADLWSSNDCDAVLIFAPNGVHSNWTRLEIPKHMPDWVRYRAAAWSADANKKERTELESVYGSTNGELRILTMNWEALQTKRGIEAATRFCNCSRRLMIVCDESDAAKNPQAIRTKELMKLKKFSHWRRIMTGTPVDGSPFSLFASFTFLDENILGTTSYFAFKAEYAEMLPQEHGLLQHIVEKKTRMSAAERETINNKAVELYGMLVANGRQELIDACLSILQAVEVENYKALPELNEALRNIFAPGRSAGKLKCLNLLSGIDNIVAGQLRKVAVVTNPHRLPQIVAKDKAGRPKYRNLEKLSKLIAPYSFRVLKKDCLDLPEKIYKTLFFSMSPAQTEIYKKAEKECRIVFEGEETPFNKLVAVTKLAQITSGYYIHPLSEEPVRIPGENQKLDLLVERVEAIIAAGEKVIVWARYRIEIEDIVARLKAAGINTVEYHGGTKKDERVDAIEAFERGEADVFVGNQQAGGTGITLIAASYVIYFSNNFSLRDRLQSEDRAHRIGQTKNVTYINIAAKDTIDEAVIGALMNKKDVAETIIDRGLKLFS